MINKKWCDPRNISILSRSCSPHLEYLSMICLPFYLPREFSSIVVTAVYIPPQADTSLALSKLHDELSGYINKHPDAASIITGEFNKANLKKVMPIFHQHVSYPTRGPNTLDHCYTPFKKCLQSTLTAGIWKIGPCRHFPHTGIQTKVCSGTPGGEGSAGGCAGPPTLKLCYRRLLMTSTGTCSGQRIHGCIIKLCQHSNRASH